MTLRVSSIIALIAVVLVLSGCAGARGSSDPAEAGTASSAPSETSVCIEDWITRVDFYESLEELAAASRHIVIGVALDDQSQLAGYPLPMTATKFKIEESIKGTLRTGSVITVADLGTADGTGATFCESGADPLRTGSTYLLHLSSLGAYEDDEGDWVDASEIWVPVFPGHYVRDGDIFRLDVPDLPYPLPDTITIEETLRANTP